MRTALSRFSFNRFWSAEAGRAPSLHSFVPSTFKLQVQKRSDPEPVIRWVEQCENVCSVPQLTNQTFRGPETKKKLFFSSQVSRGESRFHSLRKRNININI